MKLGFYLKLAWTNILKNRKIYLPYILTCIGMEIMFYIISFLAHDKAIGSMKGGDSLQLILSLGIGVIGIFSLIFLFYTNSFLMKRRKKEFGLYNILGMGKRHIAKVMLQESILVTLISLIIGLISGIAFSKLGQLLMFQILGKAPAYGFHVRILDILTTILVYVIIFTLILLNSLRQIHLNNAIDLLKGSNVGEKEPKANYLLALIGIILLGIGYYMSVTITDPMSALTLFFVAVVLVIFGTYLIFISASVALCKLLRRNKKYYYQTKHFVSLSGMIYRMKQNGAGLATICILSTMVLVMISSTACLYIGEDDSLKERYPRNFIIDTFSTDKSTVASVNDSINDVLVQYQANPTHLLSYRYYDIVGIIDKNKIQIDENSRNINTYSHVIQVVLIPLEDYNYQMGTKLTLSKNEIYVYKTNGAFNADTLTIGDDITWKIKGQLERPLDNGLDSVKIISTLYVLVPDMATVKGAHALVQKVYGDYNEPIHSYYGFDLDKDKNTQMTIATHLNKAVAKTLSDTDISYSFDGLYQEQDIFYSLYGGLFFLGLLLGFTFILAAILIMYYKQVSEGYDDQERFSILQKVGMTPHEIRQSINSQVLTVFFLPLLVAAMHIAFAFPIIDRLILLFGISNTKLLIIVTLITLFIFALLYSLIYKLTSKAYYTIVSGTRRTV